MKNIYFLFAICCFCLACAPTVTNKKTTKTETTTAITPLSQDTADLVNVVTPQEDLIARLNEIPGVNVWGTTLNNFSVSARRFTPLFVVNGIQLGCFQDVVHYVGQQEIKSVDVIYYFEPRGLYTLHRDRGAIIEIKCAPNKMEKQESVDSKAQTE